VNPQPDAYYYVSAAAPDGVAQSTAAIAAAVWETCMVELQQYAGSYQLQVLGWTPPPDSEYAPEVKCEDMAAALGWIDTLSADED